MNKTTVANLVAKLSLDTSGFTSSASSINANSVQKSIQGAVDDIDIDIKHMTLTGEVEDLKEVNAQYDIMLDAMDGVQNFSKKVTDEIGNWVSIARDVETAWVGVTKSVSAPEGVDADAYFKDLKNEVYQLSTEMPVTFQEIAAAMASAGANGISTENLLSFTEAMLQFESATNGAVTANDAATMFATINTLAQSSEENIGNMASAIVELGNHFGTPEKKVLDMSLAIASLGSNIGFTDDQIVGWSAAITRTGGSAQKSGRAFRTFANQMSYAVKETNADLEVFAKTAANASEEFADMTSEDFAELFKNNASEAMQAFIEGLDPENLSEVFKALNINDSYEQILLTNLANSADKTDLALAMASGAYQSNTALATEAEAANQTLDAQLEMFQNSITAIQAQLGETLLPVIKDIGEALLPILQDVSQFIADHPGLAATIGGVAFALEGVSIAAQLAFAAMAMGIPLSPWMGVAAAIVGVIALLALLSTSLDEIQQKASETAEEIANMDPAKEMVIENRLGEFEVIEFQYDLVPVFDESLGDYIEKEARWDEHAFNPLTGTYEGYYITKEQDEARATIEQTTAAIEEQNAALTATADTIAQYSIGEQMTEDAAKQKTALEQAQDIMNQLTQTQNDLTEATAQTGTAMDETLTNSMDQLNTLLESQAFQQFANQPVSEEVSQSWTLFGENMDKVTSGFESMQGIEFKTLPAISSEVIESYQALADAIWDMNAALTGQSKDSIEEGMTGVGQGTEEGPVGLSTILSELPNKFTQIQAAAQALADYLAGDFITAINALKKQLAIVETDEKTGEQNASGGNTLYNSLGVVKIVLEDIYSISKQIANHWKKDFVEAVQFLKKAADIAIQVTESLKASALEAADAYGQWADEIQRVIDKLTELGSLQLPSGGGGVPGKAVGGPVQGGSTYLVGEKGPELFTPTRSGYIVPNEDLYMESGGGTSITIQFNGDVIGDEATITEYVDRAARQAIREEIYAAI